MTVSITWAFFACLTVLGALGYNIAVKMAGDTINAFVFTTVLTFSALFGHVICFGIYKYYNMSEPLIISKMGVWMGILAGVSVVVIDLAFFFIPSLILL